MEGVHVVRGRSWTGRLRPIYHRGESTANWKNMIEFYQMSSARGSDMKEKKTLPVGNPPTQQASFKTCVR